MSNMCTSFQSSILLNYIRVAFSLTIRKIAISFTALNRKVNSIDIRCAKKKKKQSFRECEMYISEKEEQRFRRIKAKVVANLNSPGTS